MNYKRKYTLIIYKTIYNFNYNKEIDIMKEDIEEELINCNNHSIINITGTSTIEEDINIEENIII